jgi:hypothetical protein
LLWRLLGVLLHLSFRLKEYGAIFYAVVGFATMKHAIRRPKCVRASPATAATARCATSLTVMSEPLIKSCMVPFLRRWSKILFSVLWWRTIIRINVMHRLGVIVLNIIVARLQSFVLLWCFLLLLKLAKVLGLRLAKFCKLLIELWHCFRPVPD